MAGQGTFLFLMGTTIIGFGHGFIIANIRISMDGHRRVYDNIFVERLWRTVKYEEVYLHSYETVREAHTNLTRYFQFYNVERLHESLGYRTPHEVYFGKYRACNGQAGELIHLRQPQLIFVLMIGGIQFILYKIMNTSPVLGCFIPPIYFNSEGILLGLNRNRSSGLK